MTMPSPSLSTIVPESGVVKNLTFVPMPKSCFAIFCSREIYFPNVFYAGNKYPDAVFKSLKRNHPSLAPDTKASKRGNLAVRR
jgi:hypothetical protein